MSSANSTKSRRRHCGKLLPAKPSYKDEARVGQKGTHAYVWAPIGSRPLMMRDYCHDNSHISGAICPFRGVGAAMITPASNTECMNLHLVESSTQVSAGATAVLICDGAGWHQTGGELVVPSNVVLLHLPSYCPELTPMENVWQYLRSNKLCAAVWNSYDEIVEACVVAWRFLIDDPDRKRWLGKFGYLHACKTVAEARALIGRYMIFYNGKRPHSSLDARTPDRAYFDYVPLAAAA